MRSKTISSEKGMKSKLLLAAFIALAISALAVGIVFAHWPAITTGYAVTTNWHGIDVPGGQEVVVTAGTTDPSVKTINFTWKNAGGGTVWSEIVPVSGPLVAPDVPPYKVPQEVVDWANNNLGVTYWYAQSSHTPTEVGDWGVQARFLGAVKEKGNSEVDFVVRATSFNLVPETPWGPIAISATLLGALGLFVFRKKLPPFRAQGIR
jgi:hypothetical protein